MFTLIGHDENRDNFPWSGEPILRNGKYVGSVTSVAYGYTIGAMVCLGYIRNAEVDNGVITPAYVTDRTAHYQIVIGNKSFSAKIYAYPPKIEATNLGFYLPAKKLDSN